MRALALSTLALALLGCGANGESARDAGPSDASAPDAGETALGWRRFDVVTRMGGGGIAATGAGAARDRFTLALDLDARRAVVGGGGAAQLVPFSINNADGSFSVSTPFATSVADASCGGQPPGVYDTLQFTITGDKLLGRATGHGVALPAPDSAPINLPFIAGLEGEPDTTAPFLIAPPGSPLTDALSPFVILTSEPLPPSATARLIGSDGTVVTLAPDLIPGELPLIVSFTKPDITLAADQGFQVVLDADADLAGNPPLPGDGLRIAGFADAPLVPADGFESVTETTVAGTGVVRDAPGITITGTASVYIGDSGVPRPVDTFLKPELTVRLAVPTGATKVTFAYREIFLVPPVDAGEVQLGSIGRQPGPAVRIPAATNGKSVVWGGQPLAGSDVGVMEIPLPADLGNEVVVAIRAGLACGGKVAPGLVIDDLRFE